MLVGGVTSIVYKLTADVEISGDIQASAKKYDGFTRWALKAMDDALSDINNKEKSVLALTTSDIEAAKKEDKVAIMLGNEGGKLLEGELSLLRMFYRLGLREMQLTWAVPNQICSRRKGEGLSEFGKDVVLEMNRLGMVIDASHIAPMAFTDLLETSRDPIIISHGKIGKEYSVEQQIAMAEKGGVLGVHFYYTYLSKEGKEHIDIEDLLDQIDISVQTLGINHVGLGADFFPSDGLWADLQHAQGTFNIEWAISDVSKIFEVTNGLVRRGYSDYEIEKILGSNFLGLCKRVFGE